MRINAVFSKKVSTAQYENETYTVTVEAESEFNNVSEIADYLFNQARAAVQRQIDGTTSETTPHTTIPEPTKPASEQPQPETPKTSTNGNGQTATQKQRDMIQKLLRENFKDGAQAQRWLETSFGADNTTKLTRKVASRVIDALLDRKRQAA